MESWSTDYKIDIDLLCPLNNWKIITWKMVQHPKTIQNMYDSIPGRIQAVLGGERLC